MPRSPSRTGQPSSSTTTTSRSSTPPAHTEQGRGRRASQAASSHSQPLSANRQPPTPCGLRPRVGARLRRVRSRTNTRTPDAARRSRSDRPTWFPRFRTCLPFSPPANPQPLSANTPHVPVSPCQRAPYCIHRFSPLNSTQHSLVLPPTPIPDPPSPLIHSPPCHLPFHPSSSP